jgi:hypothetical protein
MRSQSQMRRQACALYCLPSPKAVDLVAAHALNIGGRDMLNACGGAEEAKSDW